MITDAFALTDGGEGSFTGPANGPTGKRAYGGHLAAQALASACRTVETAKVPTALHVQFLRGGDAGESVRYDVEVVHDGRAAYGRARRPLPPQVGVLGGVRPSAPGATPSSGGILSGTSLKPFQRSHLGTFPKFFQ